MKRILSFLFLFAITITFAQEKDSLVYLEVNFPLDSYRLSKETRSDVDSILQLVPVTVLKKVELYGHTDSLAGIDYNRRLSKRRVQSLLTYLVNSGVDPVIVKTDFYGEEKPKYDNGPDERFKNRRVELYLFMDPSLIPPPEQKLTDLDFKKGAKIRIPNLNFVGNQPVPVWQSFPALAELLEVMLTNPDLKIELQGHVCCGDDMELSIERAAMVYNFLRANNISADRMSYEGFSNSQPLFPERTAREKALNRRVEVFVVDNSDRRVEVEMPEINLDVRARVLNIAFFPQKSRMLPSGDFMLTLIGEMMVGSEGLFYEFVVIDNIEDRSLSSQRASAIERKFNRMRVKSDIFTVRTTPKPQNLPVSENDNYIYVKISKI